MANTGDNTIVTGAGRDSIVALGGTNTIDSGADNDSVTTGAGNDNITTGSGRDEINSGAGDDFINSGDDNDFIISSQGNDTIIAGAGNDIINSGAGVDIVDAGADNDIGIFRVSDNIGNLTEDIFKGGTGFDTLQIFLTSDQFNNPGDNGIFNDLIALRDFINNHNNTASDNGVAQTFSNLGIRVQDWEKIEIFVDGRPVDISSFAPRASLETTNGEEAPIQLAENKEKDVEEEKEEKKVVKAPLEKGIEKVGEESQTQLADLILQSIAPVEGTAGLNEQIDLVANQTLIEQNELLDHLADIENI